MARKKMTTYVDEDLLREAKVLAAKRDGKIYEVFEEALRRYLEDANGTDAPSSGTDDLGKGATSSLALGADGR